MKKKIRMLTAMVATPFVLAGGWMTAPHAVMIPLLLMFPNPQGLLLLELNILLVILETIVKRLGLNFVVGGLLLL
jgi:hypothetical protein